MEKASDTYKTIAKASDELLLKEKKSKFYGYAFPIKHEVEVKDIIENLKAKHPSANHVCYAWQIGVENPTYRANDDGEPNNTAGMPIYGQIQSFDLTNILVAVARIFGGTKLGVGGLISAYREAAKLTLENSTIKEEILQKQITLRFGYEEMDIVMRFIKKHQLEIISQEMHLRCKIVISVRQSTFEQTKKSLEAYHKIEVST